MDILAVENPVLFSDPLALTDWRWEGGSLVPMAVSRHPEEGVHGASRPHSHESRPWGREDVGGAAWSSRCYWLECPLSAC